MDIVTYAILKQELGTLSQEEIKNAVDSYLDDNPVSGMTDEQIQQLNDNTNDIEMIEAQISDLSYKPIEIYELNVSNSLNEIGSIVDNFEVSWFTNEIPKLINIKIGEEPIESIDVSLTSKSYSGKNISDNTDIVLSVIDNKDLEVSKTSSIVFLPKVYWGKIIKDSLITNETILSLDNSSLKDKNDIEINIDANVDEQIIYVTPSYFKTPIFSVGGIEGGFIKYQTINLTNSSGYSQDYDVWISVNTNLGDTTVIIK